MAKEQEISLEVWSIEDIKPYEANAKNHPPEQVKVLAKTIERDGWDQPIVVDEDGVIIKGHGRRLAAIELGLTEAPVYVRRGYSKDEIRAMRLADNQIAVLGDIDEDILKAELSDLMGSGTFSLEDIGFDEDMFDFDDADDILESLGSDTRSVRDEQPEIKKELPPEVDYKPGFQLVVDCADEKDQESLYEELSGKGYHCKVLSM